jgi:hypothetical protein
MATVKNIAGTITTVFSTGLNSLANNSNVISSAITLSTGEPGYRWGEWELYIASSAAAMTANTAFSGWIIQALDGTNDEDGGTSVTPARTPDIVFPVRAVSTAQRMTTFSQLPTGSFKLLLRNDGTGQTIASSGNTLKVRPMTESF